ncbi:MAG: permease [Gammaproteobacteria bacterium]|nr:permease [Gammaproteobacteria bacterium]
MDSFMFVIITVCLAVLGTSFISGVFGMAGGIILMGVLSILLPVRDAFVIHGAAQLLSNISRAWMTRQHIIWSIVAWFLIGWALALLGFYLISYFPEKAVVLIALGLMPWIGFALPDSFQPNIRSPVMAALCGFLVTTFQMFAGASGPLLDYFYLTSNMTRHEIVSTKAFTQGVGHFAKLIYYGIIVSTLVETELTFPFWWFLLLLPLVLLGTSTGKVLLDRMSDQHFMNIARWLTRTVGVLLAINGIYLLFA